MGNMKINVIPIVKGVFDISKYMKIYSLEIPNEIPLTY